VVKEPIITVFSRSGLVVIGLALSLSGTLVNADVVAMVSAKSPITTLDKSQVRASSWVRQAVFQMASSPCRSTKRKAQQFAMNFTARSPEKPLRR